MRMRIQVTKMMRVPCGSGPGTLFNTGSAYFRSSWSPEVKTRNTVQYRKCAYFRSSWSPEVKTRNTVQYRKCVFQIVLESGSEDSQHCSIPEVCVFQIVLESGSEDSQHCSVPEVCISDRPGVRKGRLATLFNIGSAYFRSSWSPEGKTRNTVQYRKCIFQIVLESGSEDSQHCSIPEVRISDRPGVRK
jgi:hypothetical protein